MLISCILYLSIFSHSVKGSTVFPNSRSRDELGLLRSLVDYYDTQNVYFVHRSQDSLTLARSYVTSNPTKLISMVDDTWPMIEMTWIHRSLAVAFIPDNLLNIKKLLRQKKAGQMKWIIFVTTWGSVESQFDDVEIPLYCELVFALRRTPHIWEITEMYTIGRRRFVQRWGEWHSLSGRLTSTPKVQLFTRRKDLWSHKLRLLTIDVGRFDPDVDFQQRMVAILASAANFTTETIMGTTVGTIFPNRTGVWKTLQDGHADLVILPMAVTPERLAHNQFIWPTAISKEYLFTSVDGNFDWKSYLKPFELWLWFGILLWIVFNGSFLTFIYKFLLNGKTCHMAIIGGFDAFTPFCAQGGDVSLNITIFLARLMPYINALVLLPAYSGAVLAFLTIPTYRSTFKNLDGFLQDGNHKMTYVAPSYTQIFFETNQGNQPREIRRRKLLVPPSKLPKGPEEAFENMCKDPSLVYIDTLTPSPFLKCVILRLHPLFIHPIGFAVPEYSPYKQILSRLVRRVHSAGLMKFVNSDKMPPKPSVAFNPLDLGNVFPLFVVYGTFTMAAVIFFTLETTYYRITYKSIKDFKAMDMHRNRKVWTKPYINK